MLLRLFSVTNGFLTLEIRMLWQPRAHTSNWSMCPRIFSLIGTKWVIDALISQLTVCLSLRSRCYSRLYHVWKQSILVSIHFLLNFINYRTICNGRISWPFVSMEVIWVLKWLWNYWGKCPSEFTDKFICRFSPHAKRLSCQAMENIWSFSPLGSFSFVFLV